MKRSSHCERKPKKSNNEHGTGVGLKKGPWTPEEDQKLLSYIQQFGEGSWRSLSAKAGLMRCGKSCRLRWNNYLRPDIKKGNFSLEEERTIIQLHALLGNRWSAIATHLPKRTDSQIKNHWNSHIKKRLAKMGIDPMTHKPKNDTHFHGSNLSHMTQWEAARLEAEARLVQQPKYHPFQQHNLSSSPLTHELFKRPPTTLPYLQYLDVLKIWQGISPTPPMMNNVGSEGLFNQEVNSRARYNRETMLQEFMYNQDANLMTEDPLVRPLGFFEEYFDLPKYCWSENHEAINNEGWSTVTNNLGLHTW